MKTSILGVGDTSSAGAVMSGRKWQGVVFFRPWRAGSRPLRRDSLRVLLPKRDGAARAMLDSKRVKPGVTYRFTAKLLPERRGLLPSGELLGRLEKAPSTPDLAAADAALSQPLRLRDETLGTLVRAPKATAFEGRFTLLGRRCALTIDTPDGASAEACVADAAKLYRAVRARLPHVPALVAKKLLPLANGAWLEPGRKPLSATAFARRLRPTEAVFTRGRLHLSFNCGDVFADHGVSVTLTAKATRDIHLA